MVRPSTPCGQKALQQHRGETWQQPGGCQVVKLQICLRAQSVALLAGWACKG